MGFNSGFKGLIRSNIRVSCGSVLEPSWNVMAHGDAREGKWRGNWRMEWVASTFHTTSEHGVSSITTADAHSSAASSRLNWRPCRFKWTRPFRRKTKSGFCACVITFQTQSASFSFLVLPLTPTCYGLCVALDDTQWHTHTHTHTRARARARSDPSQKRTPVNTQHSQGTDIHSHGGIRTRIPSKRAAEDPRLAPRGHLHRQSVLCLV